MCGSILEHCVLVHVSNARGEIVVASIAESAIVLRENRSPIRSHTVCRCAEHDIVASVDISPLSVNAAICDHRNCVVIHFEFGHASQDSYVTNSDIPVNGVIGNRILSTTCVVVPHVYSSTVYFGVVMNHVAFDNRSSRVVKRDTTAVVAIGTSVSRDNVVYYCRRRPNTKNT